MQVVEVTLFAHLHILRFAYLQIHKLVNLRSILHRRFNLKATVKVVTCKEGVRELLELGNGLEREASAE